MSSAVGTEQQPPAEPEKGPDRAPEEDRWRATLREIMSGSVMTGILAVLLAVLVGSVLVAATDQNVRDTAGYIGARASLMNRGYIVSRS